MLFLASCSTNHDGTYSYSEGEDFVYYIVLEGDKLHHWREDAFEERKSLDMTFKYHINDEGYIILDELIESKEFSKSYVQQMIKRWNAVGIELKDNTIYFYDDLNRDDKLMKFTKE